MCLSLVLIVPAFAMTTTGTTGKTTGTESTTLNGATVPTKTYYPNAGRVDNVTPLNGTLNNTLNGTRIGTGTNGTYGNYGTYGTDGRYGTYGTDGRYGAYDTNRMNYYRPYSTNPVTRANNTVRRMETTTARTGFGWGWLGLLGLFGLAGMRSRNRDEAR
jgi:hypothetical protein